MTSGRWAQPLRHPGAVAAERRVTVPTTSTSARVTLPAGERLVDAMAHEIEALGASSGQVELLDGSLSRVSYCVPALCHDGTTAVTFSSTREAVTPARLIAGSATVGFRHGQRFAHCHAAWFDAYGEVRGGHVWPETVIGPGPVHAVVHALGQAELISDTDAETRLPVFTPRPVQPGGVKGSGSVRAAMSRVAPGVRLAAAVRDVMRENGFERASIAGSVGSLVGAVLRRDGGAFVVDGPATEASLIGRFDLRDPSAPFSWISGVAIDRFGNVHRGEFLDEENIVAVTFELLVEEVTQ